MEKGLTPVVKIMVIALSMLFVMYLIYIFGFKYGLLTSNPCWSEVKKGLEPLEGMIRSQPELVLDARCLKRVVFTSSPDACKFTCNLHYDRDRISSCLKSCSEEDAGTFIIALPKDINNKLGKSISEKNVMWLAESRPVVYTLDCDFPGLQEGIETCQKTIEGWVCDLSGEDEDFSRVYPLYVRASGEGKTCSIVYSEPADDADRVG